jgi:uncharacterized membrane protein
LSINDPGDIVGTYQESDGVAHGFIYTHGAYITIDPPDSVSTPLCRDCIGSPIHPAQRINNAGVVIGNYFDSSFTEHFFSYYKGAFTNINPPGLMSSPTTNIGSLTSINASGRFVGYFDSTVLPVSQGFLYDHGTLTIIDFPGAFKNWATGINDAGQIAGYYNLNGSVNGFLYDRGVITTINPSGSIETSSAGINNRGQIIGRYLDANRAGHGFLYSQGSSNVIDAPGGADTSPQSINDSGQIVGYYVSGSQLHAFFAMPKFCLSPEFMQVPCNNH